MSDEMDGQVIHRDFSADLAASSDGRNLDVRVVPYNVSATVRDFGGEPYDEMWLPGVFDNQLRAANHVYVNFEHQQGIAGMVGRGTALRSEEDGFYGTFRMLTAQDADKALELVNEGSLNGISLEATPKKTIREDGVVKRIKAHLINIALCRAPAFEGAQVLAVRQAPEVAELEVWTRNTEVDARLERLGFKPLVSRKVSKAPWNGDRGRFDDEQWAISCLMEDKFPVLEPDGSISVEAIERASKQIAGGRVSLPPTEKGAVARRLVRYFTAAKLDVPENLRNVARSL